MGDADHEGTHKLPTEEEADGEGTQGEAEKEHQGKHRQVDRHCGRGS